MKLPHPVLWIDADNRLDENEAALKHIESGRLILRQIKSPLLEDSLRARQSSVETRKNLTTMGPPKKQPKGYLEFLDIMDEADKLLPKHGIRTVVIDSMTRVIEHMARFIQYQTKHGVIEESAWGIYLSNLEELVSVSVSFPCNVILIFHEREYRDEETGKLIETKALLSGQMREKIGVNFSEIWHTEIETERQRGETIRKFQVRTRQESWILCRTARPLLDVEESSFPLLMKKGLWETRFTLMLFGPYSSGKTTLALTLCDVEDEDERRTTEPPLQMQPS